METPSHCTVNTGLELPCTSNCRRTRPARPKVSHPVPILLSKISDGPTAATAGSPITALMPSLQARCFPTAYFTPSRSAIPVCYPTAFDSASWPTRGHIGVGPGWPHLSVQTTSLVPHPCPIPNTAASPRASPPLCLDALGSSPCPPALLLVLLRTS